MNGRGIYQLADGWAREKSFIRWMGAGEIIYQMDGRGINHLSDGWARDKSCTSSLNACEMRACMSIPPPPLKRLRVRLYFIHSKNRGGHTANRILYYNRFLGIVIFKTLFI